VPRSSRRRRSAPSSPHLYGTLQRWGRRSVPSSPHLCGTRLPRALRLLRGSSPLPAPLSPRCRLVARRRAAASAPCRTLLWQQWIKNIPPKPAEKEEEEEEEEGEKPPRRDQHKVVGQDGCRVVLLGANRDPPVPYRAIKVEVYDWDRDGSHDFIGEFTTSYRELARGQSQFNVYEVRRGRGDGCCVPTAPLGPTDPRDSTLHPQESPTGVTAPRVPALHLWVLHLAVPHILALPQVVNPRKKMKKKKYLNSGTVRAG
uniref:C2 domain-containing protein n=1 Tax=Meleagris gallopavo TaxID=9103 RepID=A0A803Y0K5_MELGA